jgi:acyl carrier protein
MNNEKFSRGKILEDVVQILKNITCDWDISFNKPFADDTKLMADLEFESIDIVQFIVAIEECFQTRNFPFEELLMTEGRYVDEIQVKDAVDFLHRHLNTITEKKQ